MLLLLAAPVLAASEQPLDIQPMAEGVYVGVATPQVFVNRNAGIVVMDDGELVVDTHSKPSASWTTSTSLIAS